MKNPVRRVILLGPMFRSRREQGVLREILRKLGVRASCGPEKSRMSGASRRARKLQRSNAGGDRLVGVDAGAVSWLEQGFLPDLAVGDWDSITPAQRRHICKRIPHLTLSPAKDRSDLYYALRAALHWEPEAILALGFTGGRPDHHLASLLDLSDLAALGPLVPLGRDARAAGAGSRARRLRQLMALGVEGEYHFLSEGMGAWKGRLGRGRIVSIFALNGVTRGVTLKGFEYLLENGELVPSSHGLSNRTRGGAQEIRIRRGQLLIVVPGILT